MRDSNMSRVCRRAVTQVTVLGLLALAFAMLPAEAAAQATKCFKINKVRNDYVGDNADYDIKTKLGIWPTGEGAFPNRCDRGLWFQNGDRYTIAMEGDSCAGSDDLSESLVFELNNKGKGEGTIAGYTQSLQVYAAADFSIKEIATGKCPNNAPFQPNAKRAIQ